MPATFHEKILGKPLVPHGSPQTGACPRCGSCSCPHTRVPPQCGTGERQAEVGGTSTTEQSQTGTTGVSDPPARGQPLSPAVPSYGGELRERFPFSQTRSKLKKPSGHQPHSLCCVLPFLPSPSVIHVGCCDPIIKTDCLLGREWDFCTGDVRTAGDALR